MSDHKLTIHSKIPPAATLSKGQFSEHNLGEGFLRPRAAVRKTGTSGFAIKLRDESDDALFNRNNSQLKPLLKKIEKLSVSTREESQTKSRAGDNVIAHTVRKEEEKIVKVLKSKNTNAKPLVSKIKPRAYKKNNTSPLHFAKQKSKSAAKPILLKLSDSPRKNFHCIGFPLDCASSRLYFRLYHDKDLGFSGTLAEFTIDCVKVGVSVEQGRRLLDGE
eukprot:TRINITY_DN9246_c0_g1_i1.p1 TRINITY_DN9246_c0_g1~~TRINITY_DN9246_c0_g1_i1.p1  ORF type:complete len:219 (-),score=50.91 TRINITY_DN9246_c0_g1_i1:234-890(-)